MTKRPRFSRWRRLPGVFRSGENRPITNDNDVDRLILYLPQRILDLAESLAEKAGEPSLQRYCELLLMQAIDRERVDRKVAEVESKRGRLGGLDEIASDPDYLAELSRRSLPVDSKPQPLTASSVERLEDEPETPSLDPPRVIEIAGADRVIPVPPGHLLEPDEERPEKGNTPMIDTATRTILWRHVGRTVDEHGFLPCLRRGEPVPPAKSAELMWALRQLEEELRDAPVIERDMAHVLHRLALESQVLLTDAWPGVFDESTIAVIRAVQEGVERILSGEDIRYFSNRRPGDAEQLD